MSSRKSSLPGVLFVFFWLLLLGGLSYLFSSWHATHYGGIEKTHVNTVEKTVTLSMNKSNYYHAQGHINQTQVSFIIDTGANSVAIPADIAELASLKPLGKIMVQTAGGLTQGQMTWIPQLTIGPIILYHVKAIIMPNNSKHVLLGMTALKKLIIKQHNNRLELVQPVSN